MRITIKNICQKAIVIFTGFVPIVLGCILLSVLSFAAKSAAALPQAVHPFVIGKTGPTHPIQTYTQMVDPKIKVKIQQLKQEITKITEKADMQKSLLIQQTSAQKPRTITFDNFPIKTKEMTPGYVKPTKLNLSMLPQPIFVIGSDDMSLNWLKKYQKRLKAVNAIGMLVQANNKTDYEQVQRIANGLTILPMSGEVVAQQLKIYHYPLLITRKLAEQGGNLYE